VNGVGLARFDKAWNLIAVESQGPVKAAGTTIFDIKGHFAVTSYDGKDLTVSRAMVVLSFGEGTLQLRPATGMLTRMGDVSDGKWLTLSESKSGTIKAAGATAFDIRIIAPGERLSSLGDAVASELMLKSSQ
jgi:hypothetical protein